ncbi:hypothetical protein [Streptomyces sp. NPDC001380]|uniref:hypothetical protein n=1 Tax=Streptomyces sp. NPDC001380 TaxID=3364566 RepID=UPI00369EB2AF
MPPPDEPAARGAEAPRCGGGPVRCPACRREHLYRPPALPCPCGASLRMPLLRGGAPVQVRFRSWEDSWLSLRCPRCGRSEQWPQPEFTCHCGATVRLPVDRTLREEAVHPGVHPGAQPHTAPPIAPTAPAAPAGPRGGPPETAGAARPGTAPPRPGMPFRPHPVRTRQDAVTAAARFLEWLGFGGLEASAAPEGDGVRLLGPGLVAQVEAWSGPADLRAVECLWLATLHAEESATVLFTLPGCPREAVVRAEQLLVALFLLDPSGVPEPLNGAARTLVRTGSTS